MARPRRNRKAARLSVSLEPENYAVLSEIARKHDASLAWVVRRAIGEFIHAHNSTLSEPELPLKRGELTFGNRTRG